MNFSCCCQTEALILKQHSLFFLKLNFFNEKYAIFSFKGEFIRCFWVCFLYLSACWGPIKYCGCNIFACFLTNFSLSVNALQFQGVTFSWLKTSMEVWSQNAGAILCLECIFLALLTILSITGTLNFLNCLWPGEDVEPPLFWIWPVIDYCGVSCCSKVSSLSLYWNALSVSERCSLHILMLPSVSVFLKW